MTSGTIIGLLLGAGLTFTAQAVLQLFVVPRVETRKRREDRWEKDVLALGDLLTGDLPGIARDTREKQYILHYMNSIFRHMENVDLQRLDEALPEKERQSREATEVYRELVEIQIAWLVERIVSIAPKALMLMKVQLGWMSYYISHISCGLYSHRLPDYDDEKFKETWNNEQRLAAILRNLVKQLALERRPPQNPVTHIMRRKIQAIPSKAWRR